MSVASRTGHGGGDGSGAAAVTKEPDGWLGWGGRARHGLRAARPRTASQRALLTGPDGALRPSYERAIGHPSQDGLELYDLATQLTRVVPRWADDPGSVIFWYRNEPASLNGLQSTYLWLATTLQAGGPGLPVLEADQLQLLQHRTPRHIVLLGLDPADIALGQARLADAGLHPEQVDEHRLTSGNTTLHVAVLTYQPAVVRQGLAPLERVALATTVSLNRLIPRTAVSRRRSRSRAGEDKASAPS